MSEAISCQISRSFGPVDLERGEEELLLAGEVTIERWLGEAGGLGQVRRAYFCVALLGEDIARRFDDLACFGRGPGASWL